MIKNWKLRFSSLVKVVDHSVKIMRIKISCFDPVQYAAENGQRDPRLIRRAFHIFSTAKIVILSV